MIKAAVDRDLEGSELDSLVDKILSSFSGPDSLNFDAASQMYNSEFFKDETAEVRSRICSALATYFVGFSNLYWNTFRGQ